MHDYYKDINKDWEKVLPDDIEFCHWGGRKASKLLLDRLNIQPREKVLDLCCGCAGTLGLANSRARLYGLDISFEAIRRARDYLDSLGRKEIQLIEGDALNIPFQDNYFDKAFAQDPDSFLSNKKARLLREISRVLKPGSSFMLQTYISTHNFDKTKKTEISQILRELGYNNTQTLIVENLERLFKSNGFSCINVISLHDMYASDNLKMLDFAKKRGVESLIGLLEYERTLFGKKAWTGVLVQAKK